MIEQGNTKLQVHSSGSLAALSRLAEKVGSPALAAEANALAERIAQGRLYVVCIGQFKRGKSTLLNALVGAPVLPAGVLPVTAVVTILRYGGRLGARVLFASGEVRECDPGALETYVSEEKNPGNATGVRAVEVFVPNSLLQTGMCLVDTPGIGSVFTSNTATTRAFVPHIDAALVVFGADPPISADEMVLIQEVAGQTDALARPLEETQARIDLLRRAVADAERSLGHLGHIFAAEQERLSRKISGECDGFFKQALPETRRLLRKVFQSQVVRGPKLRRRALDSGW